MSADIASIANALRAIVQNRDKKALNYAVNYAQCGLTMINTGSPKKDIRVQLLYILNNITHWRGKEATIVRSVIKEAIHSWKGE
jgi:hypothetical protein